MTAATRYDVSLEVTGPLEGADIHALTDLAAVVLEGEDLPENAGVSILLADDATLHDLNLRFRGIDAPTDVLSFADEPDEFDGGDLNYVGDIAISVPKAAQQAAESEITLDRELAHLLVHAMLHLCGYDHESGEDDENRMLAREEHYLGDLSVFHGT